MLIFNLLLGILVIINEIKIGKFCLITPGVRIMSANSIVIGDACMIAHGAYISDADWHGIYDRA